MILPLTYHFKTAQVYCFGGEVSGYDLVGFSVSGSYKSVHYLMDMLVGSCGEIWEGSTSKYIRLLAGFSSLRTVILKSEICGYLLENTFSSISLGPSCRAP